MYDWLTEHMPARAGENRLDYGATRTVSVELRYRERGLALAFLGEQARQPAVEPEFPPAPADADSPLAETPRKKFGKTLSLKSRQTR